MVAGIMHKRLTSLLKQAFDRWQMSTSNLGNMMTDRIH